MSRGLRMKIGNWELRKPWVRYVEVELEEQFYNEIRKSIGEDIAKEIEMSSPMVMAKDYTESELVEYIIGKCADIARGNK